MAKELKIRIQDHKTVERQLEERGAVFIKEVRVTDTYFNQPAGRVLKISETNQGAEIIELQSDKGGFKIVKQEKIENISQAKKAMAAKFGIENKLKKKMRFFKWDHYSISLNLIEQVGEFLVLDGRNPTPDLITKQLGFADPEFVAVPFNKLAKGFKSK